jgi:dipeptidyl aminopeptidase/acylaminoacyl peptidase
MPDLQWRHKVLNESSLIRAIYVVSTRALRSGYRASMSSSSKPYGSWRSPIAAQAVAGKSLGFGALQAQSGYLYWSEYRPDEGGRGVLMRIGPEGGVEELLPPPFSARSKVHEYGGGEFRVSDKNVFFVDADTQDIHILVPGNEPERLTHEPDIRFADMTHDGERGRLIAVAERHEDGSHEPENTLVAIALDGSRDQPLVTLSKGCDFYSTPRISPDGRMLTWLTWDLPYMPWESAALNIAEISQDGSLINERKIAGGDGSAVFQPEWSPDGRLYFVWDNSGWGKLHSWDGESITMVLDRDAEMMNPHWVFGMQSYTILDEARIAVVFIEDGEIKLSLIDANSGQATTLKSGLRSIHALAAYQDGLALLGASDTTPQAIVSLKADGTIETLRSAGDTGLKPEDVSKGEMLCFESEGEEVYALFYPPANAVCSAPSGERPPLIVYVHGGPTGMADRGLKLKIQYWTAKGFAVCDLDYSGSSGYGRAYRERLDGQWGIRDVSDVNALVKSLISVGKVDADRLLISGGSAGGFTVLMALARLDIFSAGACAYGVSDLNQLQAITHKFESGYLYGLTGTGPDNCEEVFTERSPLTHADEISCPVIFFQGLEDKVVPPEQSRSMVSSLRTRGVPVTYREFANEGHGFRSAETIIEVLESEYAFYVQVLGLKPDEALPEIEIENWQK